MNITVKVVNIILSNTLYHRQFRQTLVEAESQYEDCEVRRLSRGSMLASVYELRNEFASFERNHLQKFAASFAEMNLHHF